MIISFIILDAALVIGIAMIIIFIKCKLSNKKDTLQNAKKHDMEVFHDPSFKFRGNNQQELEKSEWTSLQDKADEKKSIEEILKPSSNIPNSNEDLKKTNGLGYSVYDDGNNMMRERARSNQHNSNIKEDLGVASGTPFEHGGMNMDNNSTNYMNM